MIDLRWLSKEDADWVRERVELAKVRDAAKETPAKAEDPKPQSNAKVILELGTRDMQERSEDSARELGERL